MSRAFVKRSSIAIAVGLAMLVQAANAGTINVDFNRAGITYVGTAIAPDAGTFWNGTNGGGGGPTGTGFTLSNLTDSTGVPGIVDLNVNRYTSNFAANPGTNGPVNPVDLMMDYIYKRDTDLTPVSLITISDLANGQYKLYVYAAGDTAGQGGNFAVVPANQIVGGVSSGATTAAHRDIYNGGLGVNYLVLDATATTGSIVLEWSRLANQAFGGLNGIQIHQVPEPASFALAALGFGCVLFRRRK